MLISPCVLWWVSNLTSTAYRIVTKILYLSPLIHPSVSLTCISHGFTSLSLPRGQSPKSGAHSTKVVKQSSTKGTETETKQDFWCTRLHLNYKHMFFNWFRALRNQRSRDRHSNFVVCRYRIGSLVKGCRSSMTTQIMWPYSGKLSRVQNISLFWVISLDLESYSY